MDLKMKAMDKESEASVWDCKVSKGIVPIITGEDENLQTATLAGLLIKGSIPQLPEVGVPWTQYLDKDITFGELDYYVRDSIMNSGKTEFYPDYQIENDQLTMTVGKVENKEYELYN